MLVLALDTTAKTASCAVLEKDADGERMRAISTVCGTLTHSETMLPMIEKCSEISGKDRGYRSFRRFRRSRLVYGRAHRRGYGQGASFRDREAVRRRLDT